MSPVLYQLSYRGKDLGDAKYEGDTENDEANFPFLTIFPIFS